MKNTSMKVTNRTNWTTEAQRAHWGDQTQVNLIRTIKQEVNRQRAEVKTQATHKERPFQNKRKSKWKGK